MDEQAKQEVIQKAYDLGFEYEKEYHGCGQCVIAALQDTFDMRDDGIFKALTAHAGGGAIVGDAGCGAYVAGLAFLSGLRGRERGDFSDPDRVRFANFAIARKLHDKFTGEYGTVICRELHTKLMGRPFFLPDQDEMKKFDEAGGHGIVCPEVCGKAAQWAAEVALDEGLVSEEHLKAITG